jgi:hypothetical protein
MFFTEAERGGPVVEHGWFIIEMVADCGRGYCWSMRCWLKRYSLGKVYMALDLEWLRGDLLMESRVSS